MRLSAIVRSVFAILLVTSFTEAIAAELIPDNDGINEALISSVAANPRVDSNFIASTEAGLYQTIDSGKTWTPFADKLFGTFPIRKVMINPQSPDKIIVTHNYYDFTNKQDIYDYYSTVDAGVHWAKLNAIQGANKSLTIYGLTFCQFHQNELFADTRSGIYFSSDNGLSWKSFSKLPIDDVQAIYFSKNKAGVMYVTSRDDIYQSTDHGGTWTKHANSQHLMSTKVIAESTDSSSIYIEDYNGIYRFDLKNDTLKMIHENGEFPDSSDSDRVFNQIRADLILLPDANHTLYLIADGKIQVSRDQGDHWQEITNAPFKTALEFKSVNAKGFFVYTTEGLFWSNATATEWYESVNGLKNIQARALAADDNGTVFAGTGANLWRKDKTNHWQVVPFFKDKSVLHLAFSKDKSGKQSIIASTWFNLYLSDDNGLTWRKVLSSLGMSNTALRVNPLNQQQVFVTSGPRVAQSRDGGNTWSDWTWIKDLFMFWDIAFNPFNSMEVTLISDGHAYVSSDGGKSWRQKSHTDAEKIYLTGYQYDPLVVNHAYAIKDSYPYLYETMDAGQNYKVTGTSKLPEGMNLRKVIIDPTNANTLYALFSDALNNNNQGGIYISKDKGANWTLLNNDMPTQFIESAQLMSDKSIYVGTRLGVYRLQ